MEPAAGLRKRSPRRTALGPVGAAVALGVAVVALAVNEPAVERRTESAEPGAVRCARVDYNDDKSSLCYSAGFLDQIMQDTHIRADRRLASVRLESAELYQYPFVVMTGEEPFELTDRQRSAMRSYVRAGGFIVASAACESEAWGDSFKAEVSKAFPGLTLTRLPTSHPLFHIVYNVSRSRHIRGGSRPVHLEALMVDGRITVVYSPDGNNDNANAGGDCCCCGGNEVRGARQINVNLLAYAMTH